MFHLKHKPSHFPFSSGMDRKECVMLLPLKFPQKKLNYHTRQEVGTTPSLFAARERAFSGSMEP